MIFLKIKRNLIVIFALFLTIIISYLSYFVFCHYKNESVNRVNYNNTAVPYCDDGFGISVLCEEYLVIMNFTGYNTTIYSFNVNNNKKIVDNIATYSKSNYNINPIRHCKLNYLACEEIVNSCGGVNLLTADGQEVFMMGNEFKNTLINTNNGLYRSYLFGILFKNILKYELFSYLYEYSDISYIDIVNNKENFKVSLDEITCIESEAIK